MFNTFTHLESIYTPFFSITKGGSRIRNTPSSGLRGVHVFILPSSTLPKLEAKQYTNSTFSFTKNGNQTIHTAYSALQNMWARQYTHHLQLYNNWELDRTHTHTQRSTHARTRARTHTHTHYVLKSLALDLRVIHMTDIIIPCIKPSNRYQ